MNATSLYVSTSRLVFQFEAGDQNLNDLYRLVPYLRQSLSCTVCGSLLIEPYTPQETQCQHHVCRLCIGGRKNLKPTCSWCRDYQKYEGNSQLRILLQCYKSLCEYIISTPIYKSMHNHTQNIGIMNGGNSNATSTSLADLIEEGAKFQDNYKSNSGLLKSTYSILPCVYTNNSISQTSHHQQQQQKIQQHNNHHHQQQKQHNTQIHNNSSILTTSKLEMKEKPKHQQSTSHKIMSTAASNPPIKTVSNGSAMYSVMYAGTGNKITIKRKTDGDRDNMITTATTTTTNTIMKDQHINNAATATSLAKTGISAATSTTTTTTASSSINQQQNFKKPSTSRSKAALLQKRKGCRCGNATPTPGKLTCCGQRCPCYVESKSCIECKCRGCRNPHRADGFKIRPHIPQLDCIEILNTDGTGTQTSCIELPLDTFSPSSSSSSQSSACLPAPSTATVQEISLSSDSIVFNPNDIDGNEIQVVNVYTTHLSDSYTPSYSLPAILMQESPTIVSQPTITLSNQLPLPSPQQYRHGQSATSTTTTTTTTSLHSIFGDDIMASSSFSEDGCSSDDRSDVEIDI